MLNDYSKAGIKNFECENEKSSRIVFNAKEIENDITWIDCPLSAFQFALSPSDYERLYKFLGIHPDMMKNKKVGINIRLTAFPTPDED